MKPTNSITDDRRYQTTGRRPLRGILAVFALCILLAICVNFNLTALGNLTARIDALVIRKSVQQQPSKNSLEGGPPITTDSETPRIANKKMFTQLAKVEAEESNIMTTSAEEINNMTTSVTQTKSDIIELNWVAVDRNSLPAHMRAHADLGLRLVVEDDREDLTKNVTRFLAPWDPLESLQPVPASCVNNETRACELAKAFRDPISEDHSAQFESILWKLDTVARRSGARYFMAAGSNVGVALHHGRVPWDDDLDVYVMEEDADHFFVNLVASGMMLMKHKQKNLHKLFIDELGQYAGAYPWKYPSIDLFVVSCPKLDFGSQCRELQNPNRVNMSLAFPLVRRPFGRLSVNTVNDPFTLAKNRYGVTFDTQCVIPGWNHKDERSNRVNKMPCTDVQAVMPFPMVKSRRTLPTYIDVNVTIEQIICGEGCQSTVMFDQGFEVKRGYADSLVKKSAEITFTLPSEEYPGLQRPPYRPLPFLPEERLSYLKNVAKRSAKTLNLEVLEMIDRVEIGNKYAGPLTSTDRIAVSFWNAERGTHWDLVPTICDESDIIILNEMDWGMARSGNVHTTKLLAANMSMNYAFGVEFLELTNGNLEEIKATKDETNAVGYHGNAILSRWPLVNSRILRLHEKYDYLYNRDNGERRLGGRMALFSVVEIEKGDQEVLIINAHSHCGASASLLLQDAKVICDEIDRHYSSISAVILGGDICGSPIAQELVKSCKFKPLETTNEYDPKTQKPVASWKVQCDPHGKSPPTARGGRGDWLLVRGNLNIQPSSLQTLHPFKKSPGEGLYQCVSDHSVLKLRATFA